jgi:hypothetical protein
MTVNREVLGVRPVYTSGSCRWAGTPTRGRQVGNSVAALGNGFSARLGLDFQREWRRRWAISLWA